MTGSKTYTIESSQINVKGGRYKSDSPGSAAKKAASMLFRKASKSPKYKTLKKLKFCIRETTSGSDKKMFEYWATRVKLVKPLVRELNGVKIINKYKISIKACSKGSMTVAGGAPKRLTAPIKKVRKTGRKYGKKGGDCGCGNP